ncbi:hypothetical protein [Konateibacter massiliensis]|uniref:hypothetical protein n=1 Tax=Konateibacter massiliensis TaxID=2002841 RepID=UPI000C15F06A|nr:hypothetical protein [Konateibacter massiliensis]
MDNKQMIDDIVAMLDSSVEKGVGHLNITANEAQDSSKTVEQLGCLDCANGDLACSIPTLHVGMDTDEDVE